MVAIASESSGLLSAITRMENFGDEKVVKSMDCISRAPGFNSHHPHGSS